MEKIPECQPCFLAPWALMHPFRTSGTDACFMKRMCLPKPILRDGFRHFSFRRRCVFFSPAFAFVWADVSGKARLKKSQILKKDALRKSTGHLFMFDGLPLKNRHRPHISIPELGRSGLAFFRNRGTVFFGCVGGRFFGARSKEYQKQKQRHQQCGKLCIYLHMKLL